MTRLCDERSTNPAPRDSPCSFRAPTSPPAVMRSVTRLTKTRCAVPCKSESAGERERNREHLAAFHDDTPFSASPSGGSAARNSSCLRPR